MVARSVTTVITGNCARISWRAAHTSRSVSGWATTTRSGRCSRRTCLMFSRARAVYQLRKKIDALRFVGETEKQVVKPDLAGRAVTVNFRSAANKGNCGFPQQVGCGAAGPVAIQPPDGFYHCVGGAAMSSARIEKSQTGYFHRPF